jgi:hypothetical protein
MRPAIAIIIFKKRMHFHIYLRRRLIALNYVQSLLTF